MAEYWGFDQIDTNGLVFISYNSLDWRRVAPIALELRKLGVPVWYDYGLEAGTKAWATQISIHIDKASALVIFVTKGIFERKESYVIEEYEEADRLDIPVIPVFLDDVIDKAYYRTIDPQYRRYVNFWDKLQGVAYSPETAPQSLAQAIKQRLDHSSQVAYTLVSREDMKTEIETVPETVQAAAECNTPGEQKLPGAEKIAVKIGARVTFGSYPQSSSTPEPIVWRVLDIIGGKALMISESILDCKKYNESNAAVTWDNCDLRRWMNGEFVERAFDSAERKKICRTMVENPNNPRYGTNGGFVTEDYVFCLSIGEAERYFVGDKDRKAKPTAFARSNKCYVDLESGAGWWWLRSPGSGSCEAAGVGTGGSIGGHGFGVCYGRAGVRPVILAQLD